MVRMILLGGFLGAGKTTTMIAAARHLERHGERVAVVTNDQAAGLVDTTVSNLAGLGVGEVSGGCFCCRFEDLVKTTVDLVSDRGATAVLAEAVGSCTDLTATVIRPLKRYYGDQFRVAPLTVLVDPLRYDELSGSPKAPGTPEASLAYLFAKQLEDADIIACNKVDLLNEKERHALEGRLRERYPDAQVVMMSALRGEGLDDLAEYWTAWSDGGRALNIDYDAYADAEAQLAWLNTAFELRASAGRAFSPARYVEELVGAIGKRLADCSAIVGHVKAQLTTPDGATSANLVRTGARPDFRFQQWSEVETGRLVLNARVAMGPDVLDTIVRDCMAACDCSQHTTSHVAEWSSFRPARPVPVHRLQSLEPVSEREATA